MINRGKQLGGNKAASRASHIGRTLILLTAAGMSMAFILPGTGRICMLIGLSFSLTIAIYAKSVFAIQISFFAILLLLTPKIGGLFQLWPLSILTPLLIYILIIGMVPSLRRSIHWHKMGRIDLKVAALATATIILSALALVGWVIWVQPDIKHHMALVPELPLWVYPFAGLGFSLSNAVMEEVAFRGIVMEALDSAVGIGIRSIVIQAVPFASYHYLAGFPNGLLGFFMVLVYGGMLGAIRRYSQGMLAPVITHIGADLTIFSIVLFVTTSSM